MKARIPLSKEQRKRVEEEARVVCIQEIEKQRNAMMRRFFKLMCYSLNDKFGFGAKRLNTLIAALTETSLEADNDPIFWEHIDRIVIDTLGVPFDRDYTEDLRK